MVLKEELFKNLNQGIIHERLGAFRRNLDKNLAFIKEYGGLGRIIPFFKGRNVIVAGAGPSLEDNLELLREIQGRSEIIILAADMALQPLKKREIIPDYVISCETTPVDFFNEFETERIHLIAFSCMSNINLRKWRGDISFFNWMIHEPEYSRLWDIAGRDLGFLATGSIVTTQAVSMALGCGIVSLALVGNDLGFYNRFYSKETLPVTSYYISSNRFSTSLTKEIEFSNRKKEFEIKRGAEKFYSNNQFLAAKLWLEELFSKKNIPVYDCSSPGCSAKYVIKSELKHYLSSIKKTQKRRKKRR